MSRVKHSRLDVMRAQVNSLINACELMLNATDTDSHLIKHRAILRNTIRKVLRNPEWQPSPLAHELKFYDQLNTMIHMMAEVDPAGVKIKL